MTTDLASRIDVLTRQLTENIMGAALCAQEIVTIVREIRDGERRHDASGNGARLHEARPAHRPLVDESTLSVIWNGKTLHLGHTKSFWLLARLTRSANRYVTHLDLLQEIWDDEFTDTTVLRAGVRRLRVKLRDGGMGDLADAVIGHHGRYILNLSAPPHHTNVTAPSH